MTSAPDAPTGVPSPAALAALAADVAREAGALLTERQAWRRTSVDTKSTGTDMVTEVDRASESLIAARLGAARPADGILGEEGTEVATSSGVRWICDPLDGTTNYLYGVPFFNVSIAAEVDGTIVAGVVHDPVHDETYSATRGGGARCNGRPLRVNGPPGLSTALVGTGFSYDPERRAVQASILPRLLPEVRDIRRAGAAALDLCWVAAGRLDAYYEWGLAPWDWAAGSLVAAEAGATVRRLPDGTTVAAPAHLYEALVRVIGG
ncbi:MAG TPA: inositol monophosphatase family protein [Acidimicrobiales bacterium]|nr:inositol monophosphatase family protein [Acidimicrobiales bacterium]